MRITAAGGIVMINDGHDRWLCREDAYDRRYDELATKPAYEGDEGASEAYSDLCYVDGPIASINGDDKGSEDELEQLLRDAVAAGLIDEETAVRSYGMQLDMDEAADMAAMVNDGPMWVRS
jgi:hypothetical protein